ncbi:MAG: hypothetical protein DLM70_18725 [Chloroflexi bacterium]|nr:MAG: hypothetical protein DLM70_18725 [Chloroflexota bacterium]
MICDEPDARLFTKYIGGDVCPGSASSSLAGCTEYVLLPSGFRRCGKSVDVAVGQDPVPAFG